MIQENYIRLSTEHYHTDIIFAGHANYRIWDNYRELEGDPRIRFCHLVHLAEFLRKEKEQVVLITDNFCDATVSAGGSRVIIDHHVLGTSYEGFDLPLPDNIVHWFGQNLNLNIEGRISPQFIGVLGVEQYNNFVERHPTFLPKEKLCYMNFGFTLQARVLWYEHLRRQPFMTDGLRETLHREGIDYFTEKFYRFYRETATHKYAIVPPGHGIDSFRLYETFLMRTIPVVINTPYYQHYKDWPILIVNDYSDLTEEMLLSKWEELNGRFDSFYDKLSRTANIENIRSKMNLIKTES